MNTYTTHSFDPKKPAFYAGQGENVQAGSIKGARAACARNVGGHVDGPYVYGPDGLAWDIIIDRGHRYSPMD